ncbi:unnamed protein product [Trichobilharzia regenti]|nr:unnamed protein product [Trichobilharzia regenti]
MIRAAKEAAAVSKSRPFAVLIANSSRKVLRKQQQRDSNVVDLHSQEALTQKQVYVFGFSATGALGKGEYLGLNGKRIKPIKSACGYGFTTYICESSNSDFGVYGCGINSDGQLGPQVSYTFVVGVRN